MSHVKSRMQDAYPSMQKLPPRLLEVLGPNAAKNDVIFFAVALRRTTSAVQQNKKTIVILNYYSCYFCDESSGDVQRFFRISEIQSPLTITTGNVSSVLIKVQGEHDALLNFDVKHKLNDPEQFKGETPVAIFADIVRRVIDIVRPEDPLYIKQESEAKELRRKATLVKPKELKGHTEDRIQALNRKLTERVMAPVRHATPEPEKARTPTPPPSNVPPLPPTPEMTLEEEINEDELPPPVPEESADIVPFDKQPPEKEVEYNSSGTLQVPQLERTAPPHSSPEPTNADEKSSLSLPPPLAHNDSESLPPPTPTISSGNSPALYHNDRSVSHTSVASAPQEKETANPTAVGHHQKSTIENNHLEPHHNHPASASHSQPPSRSEPNHVGGNDDSFAKFSLDDIPRFTSIIGDEHTNYSGQRDTHESPSHTTESPQSTTHKQPTPQSNPSFSAPIPSAAEVAALRQDEIDAIIAKVRREEVEPLRAQAIDLKEQLEDMHDFVDKQKEQLHERGQAAAMGGLMEHTAEDFTKLVQQLLALQRQLASERKDRQALINQEVAAVKASYDKILLKQQDETFALQSKVEELESVFLRMKSGIDAGGTAAAFQTNYFPDVSPLARGMGTVPTPQHTPAGRRDPTNSDTLVPVFASSAGGRSRHPRTATSSPLYLKSPPQNSRDLKNKLLLDV